MNICGFDIGFEKRFFLIAGPCVVESETVAYQTAEHLKKITSDLKINFIYKSSFQKANRSSCNSYQGPGMEQGLKILRNIKEKFEVPILTDVHEDTPLDEVIQVADVLQTPAFLCRQTNFIRKIANTQLPVNIKKGQFLAPHDMANVVNNAASTGNKKILVCERGFCFGYNNLVVDMRSLVILRKTNCPVVFDVTHALQLPGAKGTSTGGEAEYIEPLAKAAVAVGISGLFIETHPKPEEALCDGPNSLPLHKMKDLLTILIDVDNAIKF